MNRTEHWRTCDCCGADSDPATASADAATATAAVTAGWDLSGALGDRCPTCVDAVCWPRIARRCA